MYDIYVLRILGLRRRSTTGSPDETDLNADVQTGVVSQARLLHRCVIVQAHNAIWLGTQDQDLSA